jgi:hypothetical protein
LEAKVSETKEQLEALKVTIVEKSKDVIEDQSNLSLVVRCVHSTRDARTPPSQIGQDSCSGSNFCGWSKNI